MSGCKDNISDHLFDLNLQSYLKIKNLIKNFLNCNIFPIKGITFHTFRDEKIFIKL